MMKRLWKTAATVAAVCIAAVCGMTVWHHYVAAPWTRDGRTRVQVANVAPQVSGQIVELHVVDNQYVHKGDVLYVIDKVDFQTALDSAIANLQMRAADLQNKKLEAVRRAALGLDSTSVEEKQTFASIAAQAEAMFHSAQSQVAQAEINLRRTAVRSPVNGPVSNLQMRPGDYAQTGVTNLAVIDADSYWVDGYFEETKLPFVCVGDAARARLMGYEQPIEGVVDSITRGIAVSDAAASNQGLPSVNPVYTWIRLAQRVPVRIRIKRLPAGIPLVAGMTATISLDSVRFAQSGFGFRDTLGRWFDSAARHDRGPCDISAPQAGPVMAVPLPG